MLKGAVFIKTEKGVLAAEQISEMKLRNANGEPKSHLLKKAKVSRKTAYQYLKYN